MGHDQHLPGERCLQVKRLPDVGTPADSKVVNGLVFRKNVVHKLMKSHILQPRVMLLGSMLEYHRTSGKLSSFDTLLEQARPILGHLRFHCTLHLLRTRWLQSQFGVCVKMMLL